MDNQPPRDDATEGTRACCRDARRIAREHGLLKEAVEVADGAIAIYDGDERLIACNARYRDMYERGFAALKRVGTIRYGDLLRETMRGALRDRDIEAMVADRVATHRAADGTPRECYYQGKGWFRVSKTRTAGGGVVGIAADITALKESQIGLARAREKAEAALDARGRFVATLCHELRNPLNAMLGLAGLMEAGAGADPPAARLEALRTAGREMVAILDDVLDHARIDRGALRIDPAPFDVAALAAELRALYGPWAARGGVAFETDTAGIAVPRIVADRRNVYQIAGNLLTNAVKFTARGSIRLIAATRAAGDGDGDGGAELELAVADTGPGMTREQVRHLFNEFAQLPEGERAAVRGSGLGLSIARARAEAMGGRIEVTSEPGKGSRFTLTLPVVAAGAEPQPAAAEPAPEPDAAAAPLEVLVVDDNAVNRMVLKGLLERMAVNLTMVENGALAVEAAERRRFDVILMDSEMPVMDGLTATRAIRTREVLTGADPARIISISANAMPEFARECAAAGIDACLTKPIEAAALGAAVLAARDRPPARLRARRQRRIRQ